MSYRQLEDNPQELAHPPPRPPGIKQSQAPFVSYTEGVPE